MKFRAPVLLALIACSGRMNIDAIVGPDASDGGLGGDASTPPIQMTNCPKSPDARAEVVACGLPKGAQLFAIDSVNGTTRYWILEANGVTRFSTTETKVVIPMLPTADLETFAHQIGRVKDVLVYSTTGSGNENGKVVLSNGVANDETLTTSGPGVFLTCSVAMCAFSDNVGTTEPAALPGPVFFGSFGGVPLTFLSSAGTRQVNPEQVLAVSPQSQVQGGLAIVARDAPATTPDFPIPRFAYAISYAGNQGTVELGSTQDCFPDSGGMKTLSDLVAHSTADSSAAYVIANFPHCDDPQGKSDTRHVIARIGFDRDGVFYFTGTQDSKYIRAFGGYVYGVYEKTLRRSIANSATTPPATLLEGLENLGPAATDGNTTFVTFDIVDGQTTNRVVAKLK